MGMRQGLRFMARYGDVLRVDYRSGGSWHGVTNERWWLNDGGVPFPHGTSFVGLRRHGLINPVAVATHVRSGCPEVVYSLTAEGWTALMNERQR